MHFALPKLPYAKTALAPDISAETLEFHYGKHHAGYVAKLNELTAGTRFATMSLEDVIHQCGPGRVFDNAAQVWNHTFYWRSMTPDRGTVPGGVLEQEIVKAFGGFDALQKAITDAALGQFGSGWVWLVRQGDGTLSVQQTANAETPLTTAASTPLLVCDVWEHSYYIDRRHDRAAYVAAWWNLINWPFAEENYAKTTKSTTRAR